LDPERIPVIVGVGQVTRRPRILSEIREPVALIAEAARKAEEDTGRDGLLSRVDMLCVANILSWGYSDPPSRVAEAVGAAPVTRWYTGVGACAPQWFVGEAADRIAAGKTEIALVSGAESYSSLRLAGRLREPLPWKGRDGTPRIVGEERVPLTEEESRHQLFVPSHVYALFENALRGHKNQSLDEHRKELSDFCAGMSRVAESNPYAWFSRALKPEEIGTVLPENRMVAFPYTKRMCSMMFVDQSAAVLMMSLSAARRFKIPEGKYVFPAGIGEASDLWFVTHREKLHESPSVKAAAGMALAQAGVCLDDVDFLDLYSCFPCAPRIVREMLEISEKDPRPLTVTGGMPYFGGPGNNYSLHAVCRMAERLRERPGKTGLVHSLSWFLHKHVVCVYRGEPVPASWCRSDPAGFLRPLETLESPALNESPNGQAVVETYSVAYRGEEPNLGIVVGRTVRGERFLARVDEEDRDTLGAMTSREMIGERGSVREDAARGLNIFRL
jgi:acetyl-CoA C-acetyltransferase